MRYRDSSDLVSLVVNEADTQHRQALLLEDNSRIADELDYIALHCASLPRRDRRSADQIIGYDEHGLPT